MVLCSKLPVELKQSLHKALGVLDNTAVSTASQATRLGKDSSVMALKGAKGIFKYDRQKEKGGSRLQLHAKELVERNQEMEGGKKELNRLKHGLSVM